MSLCYCHLTIFGQTRGRARLVIRRFENPSDPPASDPPLECTPRAHARAGSHCSRPECAHGGVLTPYGRSHLAPGLRGREGTCCWLCFKLKVTARMQPEYCFEAVQQHQSPVDAHDCCLLLVLLLQVIKGLRCSSLTLCLHSPYASQLDVRRWCFFCVWRYSHVLSSS